MDNGLVRCPVHSVVYSRHGRCTLCLQEPQAEEVERAADNPTNHPLPITEHPLYDVLMSAITQATRGKGVRHGGATVPFMEQPWHHYAKLHGRGFLTGQAAKKLEEAASTKNGEAFINEVLGAIVYAGAAVLLEQTEERGG